MHVDDALILCTLDLCCVDLAFSNQVRALIRERCPDLPVEKVIFSATHTHTGPAYHANIFELNSHRRKFDGSVEEAIARGLATVEAGAQGGHKLARGYEPVETWSAHWLADPRFREAVADFLERERRGVSTDRLLLGPHTPFRKGPAPG